MVHLLRSDDPPAPSARVGFVVSKAVGNAVVRNRVKRRLRHLVAERIDRVGPGATMVVRALPPSALAEGPLLARELESAWARAERRAGVGR
ncbi:ribonuclease P protein component [Litorihabitans aurantiacus]|uniref:ribonuclease P protein component n=1 Tax=Litorihabitans aurantiacus TaxID=1930061 RepID=UPI0024E0C88B|nr:ribonuclease P protein component [Litorihabitans aurantiacus]